MDNQKTKLEVAKFKLEFFLVMLMAGRNEEADKCFNQALDLISEEIEAQKEPSLKFGSPEPAGASTRDQNGRAV